jgi:hypothetical protein
MVPSRFSQRCRVAGLLSWFLVRVEGRGPGARRLPTRLRTEHNKRRVTDLAWWTGAQSSMIFVKKCGDYQCQDREGWAPVKISCESKLTAPSCDVCRRGWHSFAPLERGSQHDGCVVGERWRAQTSRPKLSPQAHASHGLGLCGGADARAPHSDLPAAAEATESATLQLPRPGGLHRRHRREAKPGDLHNTSGCIAGLRDQTGRGHETKARHKMKRVSPGRPQAAPTFSFPSPGH